MQFLVQCRCCLSLLRSHKCAICQEKETVGARIPYNDPDLLDQLDKAVGGCCVFTLRYLFRS